MQTQETKIFIKTFGCKLNTYDSGWIESNIEKTISSPISISEMNTLNTNLKNLESKTLENEIFPIYILNTCAVTHTATTEAIRYVKRLRKKSPSSLIVVTGCAAQVNTEDFINLKEMGADLIVANSHKNQIGSLIKKEIEKKRSNPLRSVQTTLYKSNVLRQKHIEEKAGLELFHTRSFLKIQDGCNSFCSFCIIPFARGKSRSVSHWKLIDKVNALYAQGVKEVVLTGVHIGDYHDEKAEKDEKEIFGLEKLVEALLKKTKIPRIRLSSLEPIEISPFLLDLYKDKRLCPHFHISLQSGDAEILKNMKRKYGPKEIEQCLIKIEKNIENAFIGMDLIVGFPGERKKEFKNTYDLLKDLPWTRIHVFPYSPRKKTRSYKMENQIHRSEIKKRSKIMRNLSKKRYLETAKKQLYSIKKVLCFKEKSEGTKKETLAFYSNSIPHSPPSTSISPLEAYSHSQKEFNKENTFVPQKGLSRDYWKVNLNINIEMLKLVQGKEVTAQVNNLILKGKPPDFSDLSLEASLTAV